MGLLDRTKKNELITLLLKVAIFQNPAAWPVLIRDLPDSLIVQTQRSGIIGVDLPLLVEACNDWEVLPDSPDPPPVQVLIENALPYVEGSVLGRDLQTLRAGLPGAPRPIAPLAASPPPLPGTPVVPIVAQKLARVRGAVLRLYHALDRAHTTEVLARLRGAGADAIALTPHQYCLIKMDPGSPQHNALLLPANLRQREGQYIFADTDEGGTRNPGLFGNTPPLADVRWLCALARDLGMQVLLNPQLDPLYYQEADQRYYSAGWRGFIELDPADVEAFRRSYLEDYLAPYLSVAQDLKLQLFSIGGEFVQITRAHGAAFWRAVADGVGTLGYTGDLVYTANWGWGDDAEFMRLRELWQHPRVGYVGVNAYYPLWPLQLPAAAMDGMWEPEPNSPEANPTVEQLVQGWTQPHRLPDGAELDPPPTVKTLSMSQITGKPLLFTEIGYANRRGAAWNPGRDPVPGDQVDDPTQPGSLQERLFEAFLQVWGNRPDFAGFFWWNASLSSTEDPRTVITHNILGTRLEQRLFREFPARPQ